MAKKFCIFLLTKKELYYILIKSDAERTRKRELDIDSFYAIVAQLVERHLAKVETAGSSPVYRFFNAAESHKMWGSAVFCVSKSYGQT